MFITIQTILHKNHADSYVLVQKTLSNHHIRFPYNKNAESAIQAIKRDNVVIKTERYATICGTTGLPINVISEFIRIVG